MTDLHLLWQRSAVRLERRLAGLTDAEYFWAPVSDAWNVHRSDSGWTYPYEFAPPPPAPVTTISWRLVHIVGNNRVYWDYAFGTALLTFPDLPVPSTADAALASWRDSAEPIERWLASASSADLDEMRPNHLRPEMSAREIVTILLDEQIHHGAEIALLRDLYIRMVLDE
jgi:DinB superfamily